MWKGKKIKFQIRKIQYLIKDCYLIKKNIIFWKLQKHSQTELSVCYALLTLSNSRIDKAKKSSQSQKNE